MNNWRPKGAVPYEVLFYEVLSYEVLSYKILYLIRAGYENDIFANIQESAHEGRNHEGN